MADPMARGGQSLSGLSEEEARSFHGMFVTSFLVFTAIAVMAHWAVWQWRPWIPGVAGYKTAAATAPAINHPATVATVATR